MYGKGVANFSHHLIYLILGFTQPSKNFKLDLVRVMTDFLLVFSVIKKLLFAEKNLC